jgi:hypothetical protein
VREVCSVFGAMLKSTTPAPVPAAALRIVSQLALLVAVQPQLAVVATSTTALPPATPMLKVVGEAE